MIHKLSHEMYVSRAKHHREVKHEQKPGVLLVRRLDRVKSLYYALETLCRVGTEIERTQVR